MSYPFSGKIVEAYYTNAELNTVNVLWSDGKVNREYYVNVDEEDHQFQALLKEWSYESLDECTRNKNEQFRQEFRDAFHEYATTNNLYGHGDDGSGQEAEERQASFDLLFNFVEEDEQHKEMLFKLKLKMFEQDCVKNSKAKKGKTDIRKSSTPLEAIVAYNKFVK
jgi:hypothetical protein|tara:strand:+ start:85 stop:582 length:498 start_codon:yes stop_codon:yes gene_type:complete